MLGNGYKERLANAQNSIGSLLLNLSKQQQMNSSSPTSSPLHDSNEPGLDLPLKQSFASKLTAPAPAPAPSPPLPSTPAPALESNSSSRYSSLRQQPQQQQQQQQSSQHEQRRTSRLPSAGFSLGRLLDHQFPELGSQIESNGGSRRQQGRNIASSSSMAVTDEFGLHLEPSFALGQGQVGASSFNSSRSPSRWDGSTPGGSTAATSVYDGHCTPMSNSPTFATGPVGNRNGQSTQQQQQPLILADAKGFETGIRNESTITTLEAALVIQRAVRCFLVRKHAKATVAQATAVSSLVLVKDFQPAGSKARNSPMLTAEKQQEQQQQQQRQIDLESLQQTCLHQSAEINQLKDMMTRLLLEAEEDRRKLRQRDQEVEELLKQRLVATTSTPPPSSALAALPPIQTSGFDNILSKNASRFSAGHMGAGHGMASAVTAPSFSSYGLSSMQSTASALGEDLTHHTLDGISDEDYYGVEGLTSFANATASTGNVSSSSVHPLSVSSRPNSIHSVHSQQSSTGGVPLALKINAANAYAYQGYMDMVDSPTSDYSPHPDLGSGLGRQQQQPLPGFNPQGVSASSAFPTLSHRSSAASFSSGSRAFDSPALEQQGSYPWNMNANAGPVGVNNSPSWNDDMSSGYGYDSPTSATFQSSGTMGHAGGYDPQYISQYGQHVPQLQQQTQQQPQSAQQTQQQQGGGGGSSSYRNNYRRHSDKPVHLDYQMCVDRILQATDQQASIHLQQKLKTSPPEQKIQIIDAILGQAYALMSNRFGNFLIQRCFEFGSAQQIDALAQAMRGNILTLACDPFGCHVVQKALDNVEEDAKARIVTEMFRRIRETIVHRYACHVWQKVFEIRWTDAPPAVMTYVNSAVTGRWASVAVDETGSLVVQNIFENCAEHDKRPVLNEILQSVTTIAKGQWGNWVIQHILEHGSPTDRATVTQKILEDAVNLSLDQYASKVVEKTLRMAANSTSPAPAALQQPNASTSPKSASLGNVSSSTPAASSSAPPTVTIHGTTTLRLTQEEVMGQYIHIVCDGVPDRPRIPLIDIAADQYGNYIVQYILTHAGPQHREICAALIKRHMVSLRGSKYGQKVAFMVERWRGSPFSNNNNNGTGGGGISGGEGRSNGGGNGGGGGSGGPGAFTSKMGSGSDGHGHEQQRSSGGRRRW